MASHWIFGRAAFQISTLFASFLFSVVVIYTDVLILDSTMGERSFVQISQALMILGSAVFFAAGALSHADKKGYLLLVATLFLCMFVRENDGLLDSVSHGFWRVPVFVIAIVGAVAVFKNSKTLLPPLRLHAQDSSFWILSVGFLQLVVFSRLFGSGQLWGDVVNAADLGATKAIIQESSELVCYSLLFLGSYLSYKYGYRIDQSVAGEKAQVGDVLANADTAFPQKQSS